MKIADLGASVPDALGLKNVKEAAKSRHEEHTAHFTGIVVFCFFCISTKEINQR